MQRDRVTTNYEVIILFSDYYWKNGRPIGIPANDSSPSRKIQIIADPYFKHISIEEYLQGKFNRLIYDSRLLDFRTLKSEIPASWQRIEEPNRTLLRDQNDRLVFIETYSFDGNFCKECTVYSPHGLHLSTHKIYSTKQGDTFNGVELYDADNKLVMRKLYELNEEGSFGELIKAEWEFAG